MEVLAFKVNLKTAFSDSQLIKGGWEVEEKDILYFRIKGKYKYSYNIKSFGKIRVSEIKAELNTGQKLSIEDMFEFSFVNAWISLWNKSFIPDSVEIFTKENLLGRLLENGWKPAVIGVVEYVTDKENLSFYYPAPEGESLYKLVDDNPGDVLEFVNKLKKLNIL